MYDDFKHVLFSTVPPMVKNLRATTQWHSAKDRVNDIFQCELVDTLKEPHCDPKVPVDWSLR